MYWTRISKKQKRICKRCAAYARYCLHSDPLIDGVPTTCIDGIGIEVCNGHRLLIERDKFDTVLACLAQLDSEGQRKATLYLRAADPSFTWDELCKRDAITASLLFRIWKDDSLLGIIGKARYADFVPILRWAATALCFSASQSAIWTLYSIACSGRSDAYKVLRRLSETDNFDLRELAQKLCMRSPQHTIKVAGSQNRNGMPRGDTSPRETLPGDIRPGSTSSNCNSSPVHPDNIEPDWWRESGE